MGLSELSEEVVSLTVSDVDRRREPIQVRVSGSRHLRDGDAQQGAPTGVGASKPPVAADIHDAPTCFTRQDGWLMGHESSSFEGDELGVAGRAVLARRSRTRT